MSEKLKVAVLMGGTSAERPVSLSTGRQIVCALDPSRYDVAVLDSAAAPPAGSLTVTEAAPNARVLETDSGEPVTALIDLNRVRFEMRPDVVFIALHGPGGEDGTVQGMLEVLGVPYTGSGVLASALAMDKAMSKRLLTAAGVLMPRDFVVRRGEPVGSVARDRGHSFPVIVKPSRQGSTFGVTVVDSACDLADAIETAFRYDNTALIEQYITGVEITVPIIGNRDLEVLPIVEIVPASGFYDYEAKYTAGATDEIVPARLADHVAAGAREIALKCHGTLGCRGMSRTDMIVTAAGDIFTLEVNTIPGMTPTSLLPRSAEAAGIGFSRLLDRLITLAREG
ncbi:MAG: D-alanine--D-alanine ligase [Capsulimonadaceae bacterium]